MGCQIICVKTIIITACLFIAFFPEVLSKDDGTTTCNISSFLSAGGRYKRSSSKQGLMVCITAKPGIDSHNHKHKDKHHHHDQSQEDVDDDDESSSNESRRPNSHSNNNNYSEESESEESPHSHGGGGGGHGHSHKHMNNHPPPPVHHGSNNNNKHQYSKPKKHRYKRDLRVIVEEQFTYRNWSTEWVHAKNDNSSTTKIYNKFSRVYARKSNHSRPNYAIITNNKNGEFYMIATSFPPFNNRNETLVIQFSVQFQSKAHCQLAFLRLFDCQFGTDDFSAQTPYIMQVGPNICGTSRLSRVSAEFQEPGKTTIKSVDRSLEPVNNTSVNTYALALEPDGTYHIIVNANSTQNGTLKDEFNNYKGYTGICAVGLLVWHSVLDKYFKGQIIIDDILVVNDLDYAERQRRQILNLYSGN